MPRRVRFIVFLGVVTMLVLATGISAGAQAPEDGNTTTEEEISAAQERLMEIRSQESDALADYNIALHKMNELNGEIADAEKDLQAAEEDLAEAQASLEERASQVYRSGNVGFVDVLVGVDDFSQFASRVDLWMRLLEEERAAYEAVLQAKNEIEDRKSKLETERARRVEAVDEALNNKEQVADAEAEAEELRREVDMFIDSRMAGFESVLAKTATQVRTARKRLAERNGADQDEEERRPRATELPSLD